MKVIHYWPRKENWPDSKLRKIYVDLKLDNDFPFLDRTETIPHYLDTKPLSRALSYDSTFNLSFSDICSIQANEILDKNKKVNVLWSGGLDSTVALVSLLSNSKNKNQIRILANYNSIIESGYMYDVFFKKYDTEIDTRLNFNENELYITGALGNQLFSLGAFDIENKISIADLQKPYTEIISKEKQEFYAPALLKSSKPIKTVEEFLWFETFAFKWDHQRIAMIIKWLRPNSVENYLDKVYGFYYNKLFEQWSIQSNEQQYDIKNFATTNKMPMRKYLLKELGSEALDYVNNKKVTHSIFNMYHRSYIYTTEDYKVHYDHSLQ
jgi:hypothetical protein